MTHFQIQMSLITMILILWSLIMWAWLLVTRLKAVKNSNLKFNRYAVRGEQLNQLPARVRWVADNYNHLTEQPTHFYPLILLVIFFNLESSLNLVLASGYVSVRIVHSIYQATVNKLVVRLLLFVLGSLFFIAMVIHNLINILNLL